MPPDPIALVASGLQFSEAALRWTGIGLVLVGAIALTVTRRWRQVLRLPAAREPGFGAVEVLIGLYAMYFFPVLFGLVLNVSVDGDPTSQPAPPGDAQLEAAVLGQFCAAAFLIWLGTRRTIGGAAGWGLRRDRLPRDGAAAVLGYVAVWPVCAFVLTVTTEQIRQRLPGFEMPEHEAIRTLAQEDLSSWTLALTATSACVLAPIVEELFFRGILQPAIARTWRSQWFAIVVAGIAFGGIHYPNVQTIPALVVFGIVLGYAYAKTRSLTLVILLHAVFNGKTVLWLVLGGTAGAS